MRLFNQKIRGTLVTATSAGVLALSMVGASGPMSAAADVVGDVGVIATVGIATLPTYPCPGGVPTTALLLAGNACGGGSYADLASVGASVSTETAPELTGDPTSLVDGSAGAGVTSAAFGYYEPTGAVVGSARGTITVKETVSDGAVGGDGAATCNFFWLRVGLTAALELTGCSEGGGTGTGLGAAVAVFVPTCAPDPTGTLNPGVCKPLNAVVVGLGAFNTIS
ncbi:MAG: hypothetical protein ACYDGR_07835 [Candidatus Dormibacteria bacterium]